MEILFKYAWILFILVTVFNAYQLKKRFQEYIVEKPEREEGYNLIVRNFIIYSSIPWIIMGAGNLSGETHSVFEYLEPARLKPFVLLFHFAIVVIWLLIIRFIFFSNGAEFLEKHPGLIQVKTLGKTKDDLSQKHIKLLTALMLAGGMVALILMWSDFFKFPPFT